jgi:ComF family protein
LPYTGFEKAADNPVEKLFWGRLPVVQCSSAFYYTSPSVMHQLVRQVKYRGDQSLCYWLGTLMAGRLLQSGRFIPPDVIVPLPLHFTRKMRRGFNQSEVLSKGIAAGLNLPVRTDLVIRSSETATQTRKGRTGRWQNMEGRFELTAAHSPPHSVLLIDDVITTGATLEACGRTLLKIPGLQLSVATLCFADGS